MVSKAPSSRSSVPDVLRFKARLAKSATTASGAMLVIPKTIERKLAGLPTVEGTINGHPFRAPLDRTANGCTLRVNQAMLRGSAARVGDDVLLAVLGPEPELVLAPDVRRAIEASRGATALWSDMSDLARRDYVRWVDGTKNPDTRARRIRRTVEELEEGKRRPCCFNAYEYPLSIIDPDWLERTRRRG
jgi:hypothetical protein